MSYLYLNRLHFLVCFKNPPITRTAIFLNHHFILKTFDLRFVTSGAELQNYHSVNFNFLHEKIVSALQNNFHPYYPMPNTQNVNPKAAEQHVFQSSLQKYLQLLQEYPFPQQRQNHYLRQFQKFSSLGKDSCKY